MRKFLDYLPLASALVILSTTLIIAAYSYQQEFNKSKLRSSNLAQQLGTSLEILSADRSRALRSLAENWPTGLANPVDWFNVRAKDISRMLPGFEDIILSDAQAQITWSIQQDNRSLIATPLQNLLNSTFDFTHEFHSVVITLRSEHYVALSMPVYINDKLAWYLTALIDNRAVLYALTSDFEERQISLDVMDGNFQILSLGKIKNRYPYAEIHSSFAKRDWRLQTQSYEDTYRQPSLIALTGFLLSIAVYLILSGWLRRELHIKELQSFYQSAADASLDGVLLFVATTIVTRPRFTVISLNKVAAELFYQIHPIPSHTSLTTFSHHIGYPQLEELSLKVYQHGEPFSDIIQTHERMSPVSWLKIQLVRTEKGVALTLHDVSKEQELQQKIVFQAHHDQLTGLLNRYAFSHELQRLVGEQSRSFLCYIDMDRFKQVNDSCGHVAGDELLQKVAQLLSSCLKRNDVLARVGGDEFCLVIRNKTLPQVKIVLDRLLKLIADFRFRWNDQVFIVGASIGVLELSDGYHRDPIDMMKAADAGCYIAKNAGRNQYFIVDDRTPEFNHIEQERYFMNVVRRALVNDEFTLYAQPIIPLAKTGQIHIEILLRLKGDTGEDISPGVFIPLAERQGMMREIDQWVITKVLSELEHHPEYLTELDKCAINISAVSLCDLSFLPWLVAQLKASNVPGSKLCFEITETAAITNLAHAQKFIRELRQLGCRFSLDDFGVGMSSFGSLKTLDVDYVKIDGSFVRNMKCDSSDAALVKAMTDIVHSMKKEAIAEFVSDNETCILLKEFGVEYGQGFGLAMPEPWTQICDKSK
ncbi:diguanylate cyclase (GGDEF) domain-containing protein [Rheinheimera sp. A13L]|uniref:putative bifunctional diguanylate cyclase/phosphodiesterase n=1 Tax=Rheinheimera sp. A13L TaxID=506534 RepID=UPI0002124D8B|nr:EAL domain-containing protein [Rheinheimera sp. A13L]EGM77610.1 diguanylate cyclase (GGDEF) domain-containing protein [Rheinheimera sp. A13L]